MPVGLTGGRAITAAGQTNVVLIVTDDVGYGDIGSYRARDVKTPSIDSLARDGVRLTDFYGRRDTAALSTMPPRRDFSGPYRQPIEPFRILGRQLLRRRAIIGS